MYLLPLASALQVVYQNVRHLGLLSFSAVFVGNCLGLLGLSPVFLQSYKALVGLVLLKHDVHWFKHEPLPSPLVDDLEADRQTG